MTVSSGDDSLDEILYKETMSEMAKGWVTGPYELSELETGATISRRFPLAQGQKTRLIDDFTISGVNDSCIIHNKVDLHMIDTFCAGMRRFFRGAETSGTVSCLERRMT